MGWRSSSPTTKPLVGHTLGASGAVEAAFCWLAFDAVRNGSLALMPHHWDAEPDADIAPLCLAEPGQAVSVGSRVAIMSNSFGFGGNNCSLILAAQPA